jgi:molecular chaperone IbpA
MRELTYSIPNMFSALDTAFSPWKSESRNYQLLDVDRNESLLYISAPGYTQDDISIEMQGGQLTIKGQKEHTTEIVPYKLDYKFNVSTDYRVEDATLEHGLLAVRLIRQHRAEAVKIPIK